jgi:4'-phosphopantetheinyl transferase
MIEQSVLRNTIHLWSASLNQVEGASTSILDGHERQTADRFRNAEKRLHYIKSHWLLRHILSRYVGQQAGSIRIAYHEHGKPYLPDHTLYYSLSHSHEQWIVALTRGREIGADIEKLEPLEGMDAIIRRYYPLNEQEKLNTLDSKQKTYAFYKNWTQMEAFVKMHRMGLYARMNTIQKVGHGLMFEGGPDSWAACESYPMQSEYIASIAMKGSMYPVVMMDWSRLQAKVNLREE